MVPPLLRAMLLQILCSIRSKRRFVEQTQFEPNCRVEIRATGEQGG